MLFLSIVPNIIVKLEIEAYVSQGLHNFHLFLASFWQFEQFPMGDHRSNGISYTWNGNVHFSVNISELHYTAFSKEDQYRK